MTRRGILLFAAMSVIWGIPYLFIRIAVLEVPPGIVVFGRTVIGALILLPIALRGRGLAPVLRRWRPLLAFTAVEIAIPWYLLTTAEETASSSFSGLVISAVPLFATGIAIARGDREATKPAVLAGLLLGIAGVAAIVGIDLRGSTLVATLELLGVVACYATGPVVLARYLGDLPGPGVMGAALGICALIYLPLALLQPPARLSPSALGSIAVLGVVCTALAFVLFSDLVKEIGPVRSTVITYVNPAVALVLGVALLQERVTPGMVVGFLLVLVGSVLATRRAEAIDARPAVSRPAIPPGVVPGPREPAGGSSEARGGPRR
jgi:drug/metabolite transporter (DMT)-like permease